MQPVNDHPRENLSASDVFDLINVNANVKISYGCRWLDRNRVYRGDLTEFMAPSSTVSRDMSATIHGTCNLLLRSDAPIDYLTDFVQPSLTLSTPGGVSAEFYLGVFGLETPEYDNSNSITTLSYTGYDLLYYLSQPIGDSLQAIAGTNPVDKAATVIGLALPGASITSVPTSSTLQTSMGWPLDSSGSDATYLDIVNELLAAAGYAPVWVDWAGRFILAPYIVPSKRNIETIFDLTSSNNIVVEERSSTQDLFNVPNYWRFIMNNLTDAPQEGVTQYTYEDNSITNPGSIVNRGRIANKKTIYVTSTDYASLFQYGSSVIVDDLSPGEIFTLSTFPFPLAWHEDQITLNDPNMVKIPPLHSDTRHTQGLTWTITLDAKADQSWTIQTVTQ